MRRLLPVLLLAAAVAVPAMPASGGGPKRLQVVGDEWNFQLSRPKVSPGETLVEFNNFGEDPHDLKMQKWGGGPVFAMGEVGPSDRAEMTARLKPGRWKLWCSLAGHEALGMYGLLVVKDN